MANITNNVYFSTYTPRIGKGLRLGTTEPLEALSYSLVKNWLKSSNNIHGFYFFRFDMERDRPFLIATHVGIAH